MWQHGNGCALRTTGVAVGSVYSSSGYRVGTPTPRFASPDKEKPDSSANRSACPDRKKGFSRDAREVGGVPVQVPGPTPTRRATFLFGDDRELRWFLIFYNKELTPNPERQALPFRALTRRSSTLLPR